LARATVVTDDSECCDEPVVRVRDCECTQT
jgi:hypothetical protein